MSLIHIGEITPKFRTWCQENYPPELLPIFCFTANENGANVSLIGWDIIMWYQCDIFCHLQYSIDKQSTWNAYYGQIIYLDSCSDKKVYFRADPENPNTNGFYDSLSYRCHKFIINGSVAASGNIQYLLTSDGSRTDVPQYCYYRMFSGCTTLTQAPELPATTLASNCYCNMFSNCSSLTQAPQLPATTLAIDCYNGMFSSCTSLTKAPQLPATTLARSCYQYMFQSCTSLTQAPELPATTLADSCYANMFYNCTSLTQAPELPATTLADFCYEFMFKDCTSLMKDIQLPATTLYYKCYDNMFAYCNQISYCHMKSKMLGIYNHDTHGRFNDPYQTWIDRITVIYDLIS